MTNLVPVTVAKGDGIGPEIMDATLEILKAAGARIQPEFVTIGLKAYDEGVATGVTDEAWQSIQKNKIILKAPITTPQGGGFKSVNVTLRKAFGLFSNVRPTQTYEPYVATKFKGVDLVIVRENEEDLYAGIEYRPSANAYESLKLLTAGGSERIVRYAFEYARANGRKKVSCMIKDNIMKMADGMFHNIFKEVAKEYPEIEADSYIVDIGMALVAAQPERFDVIVTLNLYGDIVSDIASQVAGSVGLAGSMNVGEEYAMFEAIHGSAPDIAGKGIANPSGLLNGALMMLAHLGQHDVVAKIYNAWALTLEEGCHTGDIATDKSKALNTKEFTRAVVERLGKEPKHFKAATSSGKVAMDMSKVVHKIPARPKTELIGVDVYVENFGEKVERLGAVVEKMGTDNLKFKLISNRGMKVYPGSYNVPAEADLWRCRFYGQEITTADLYKVLKQMENASIEWVKVQKLYSFDGVRGFSLAQGE